MQRCMLARDVEAFLGFNGLMHAELPLAAWEDAAGGAIDDFDLVVADDVVLALVVDLAGGESLGQTVLLRRGPDHGGAGSVWERSESLRLPASVRAVRRRRCSTM